MNRRLHRALLHSSETRALIVLILVLGLRAWRITQIKYQSLPDILQIVDMIRARVLSSPLFDRRYPAHWVGYVLSRRERVG